MSAPLIAIVGSVASTRSDYDPPLRNAEVAREAAEQLGAELARAGNRIIVYSGDPRFIEGDIVRGYVASGRAQPDSIQIRYPQILGAGQFPSFPEQSTHETLFDVRADRHTNWEISFYMSLKDATGIVLIGGARSALVTGLVAQSYRIPLVPVATFGGSAQTVWALASGPSLTEAERNLMGRPRWAADSAEKLVRALADQAERLRAERAEQIRSERLAANALRQRAFVAAGLVLAAVILTTVGLFAPTLNPVLFGLLFLGTPLFAGASGGVVRTILDSNRGLVHTPEHSAPTSAVLGMIAGLIAALLFVLAQVATNSAIKHLADAIDEHLKLLIPFALVVGFVAGLTLEAVFGKLERTDVVNVAPITTKTMSS